jgi:hypothetical protein
VPDNPFKTILAIAALLALLVWLASGRRMPWYIHATAVVFALGGLAAVAWLASRGMPWKDLWVVAMAAVLGTPLAAYGGYALHQLTTPDEPTAPKAAADARESGARDSPGHASSGAATREASRATASHASPGSAAPIEVPFTPQETGLAARLAVYSIYAIGTSPHGWPDHPLFPVAFALTREAARRESESMTLQPGWDEFRTYGPFALAGLVQQGSIDQPRARSLLERARAGEPHELLDPPLTEEEMQRAEKISVYTVYYEDRFHFGGGRESHDVAVAFTREEAEREAARRGLLPESGGDGHDVYGPSPLSGASSRALVREMLARHARGETGVLPIQDTYP